MSGEELLQLINNQFGELFDAGVRYQKSETDDNAQKLLNTYDSLKRSLVYGNGIALLLAENTGDGEFVDDNMNAANEFINTPTTRQLYQKAEMQLGVGGSGSGGGSGSAPVLTDSQLLSRVRDLEIQLESYDERRRATFRRIEDLTNAMEEYQLQTSTGLDPNARIAILKDMAIEIESEREKVEASAPQRKTIVDELEIAIAASSGAVQRKQAIQQKSDEADALAEDERLISEFVAAQDSVRNAKSANNVAIMSYESAKTTHKQNQVDQTNPDSVMFNKKLRDRVRESEDAKDDAETKLFNANNALADADQKARPALQRKKEAAERKWKKMIDDSSPEDRRLIMSNINAIDNLVHFRQSKYNNGIQLLDGEEKLDFHAGYTETMNHFKQEYKKNFV